MKIGVVVDNTFDSDPRVQHEVNALKALGHDVHVLCYTHQNSKKEDKIHRVKKGISFKKRYFPLINTFPYYQWYWTKQIKDFINEIKPDILHVHDLYMSSITYNATRGKIPFILDLHENFPEAIQAYSWVKNPFKRMLVQPDKWRAKEADALQLANKIIVLSHEFKTSLLNKHNFLQPDKIVVVPNFPDLSKIRVSERIEDASKRLFYFGVIGRRRGIDVVLNALPALEKEIPNIRFKLIGPIDKNDKEYFNKLFEDKRINSLVEYKKWIAPEDLTKEVADVDLCVCPIEKNPQHESGVANKVFQYMALGKAQIVSDCKPQANLVEKEKCGVIFKNGSSTDFSTEVIKLFQTANKIETLSENAKKAIKNYDEDKFQHFLKNVYRI